MGLNIGVTAFQRVFFPTDRNLWQEIEKQGGVARAAGQYGTEEGRSSTSAVPGDSPSDLPLGTEVAFAQKPRDL